MSIAELNELDTTIPWIERTSPSTPSTEGHEFSWLDKIRAVGSCLWNLYPGTRETALPPSYRAETPVAIEIASVPSSESPDPSRLSRIWNWSSTHSAKLCAAAALTIQVVQAYFVDQAIQAVFHVQTETTAEFLGPASTYLNLPNSLITNGASVLALGALNLVITSVWRRILVLHSLANGYNTVLAQDESVNLVDLAEKMRPLYLYPFAGYALLSAAWVCFSGMNVAKSFAHTNWVISADNVNITNWLNPTDVIQSHLVAPVDSYRTYGGLCIAGVSNLFNALLGVCQLTENRSKVLTIAATAAAARQSSTRRSI